MIQTILRLLPEGSRPAVAAHLGLTVVSIILRAVGAVLLVPLVSALLGPEPDDAWGWVGLLAAVTALGWVVDAIISRLAFDLGFGLLDTAQHRIAERLTRIRLSWFGAKETATARESVAATGPDLVGMVAYQLTPLLGAVLLPVAIGVALLPIAWPLGVVALLGVLLLVGAQWLGARSSAAADRAAAQSNTELTERLVEFARTQQALRAARRADPERSQVGAALSGQHAATVRMIGRQVPGQVLSGLATQVALLALAGTTVWLMVRGELEVPAAIALLLVAVRYLEAFTVVAQLGSGLETTTRVLRTIRTVLEAPTDPVGQLRHGADAPPELALRGVTFSYQDGERPVLQDLDLTLAPGTTTALVGPSGSGKSTVLGLLAGLHHPDSGRVEVDGTDLAALSVQDWRALVSMVFQHPYLFEGTIVENVRAGAPDADGQALEQVAELARLSDVLARDQDGWDGRVGEAGGVLSGGERQRVSIARALLKPAPVLLVDEATSALDTENEVAVVRALSSDPVPRTRVIVAHRLSSIRTADRVLFLEGGQIVEDGGLEELLAAGGRFARFWREQEASSGWRLRQ